MIMIRNVIGGSDPIKTAIKAMAADLKRAMNSGKFFSKIKSLPQQKFDMSMSVIHRQLVF